MYLSLYMSKIERKKPETKLLIVYYESYVGVVVCGNL